MREQTDPTSRYEAAAKQLRDKMEQGLPLSIFDLGFYSMIVLKNPMRIVEPAPTDISWRDANAFYKSWMELLEKKVEKTEDDFTFLQRIQKWENVKFVIGADDEEYFLEKADTFIESHIKELQQFNDSSYANPNTAQVREMHILSLINTKEDICAILEPEEMIV